MAEKKKDLTLEEIWDLETKFSATLGRPTGICESGMSAARQILLTEPHILTFSEPSGKWAESNPGHGQIKTGFGQMSPAKSGKKKVLRSSKVH